MMSLRNSLSPQGAPMSGVRRRRGVAMLLVLVALGLGTVLAAASLSSRDNTPAIGANACDFAKATWSAHAGAELAMAILETNVDWLSKTDGHLMTDFALAGGLVTVTVTNLAGQTPDGSERELVITVRSDTGEMSSTVHKRISVVPPGPIENSISPFFDEFAAYATEELLVEDLAEIKPVHVSPEAWSLVPTKVGLGFAAIGSLDIDTDAKITNAGLYVTANASAGLASVVNTDPHFGRGDALPLKLPAYPVKLPSQITSLPVVGTTNIDVSMPKGSTPDYITPNLTLSKAGKYGAVTIQTNSVLRLDEANGQYYELKGIQINAGGVLQIKGKVVVHVKGKLDIKPLSTVTLVDDTSAVRFLTSDDVDIENATMGLAGTFATFPRTTAQLTKFVNPARIRIITVNEASGGKATPHYDLHNNAFVLACIHAPNAEFEAKENSFLIGRVTSKKLKVRTGSGILYEPLLDSRRGYTARYGPMYENGTPLPGVVTTIAGYTVGEGAESITGKIIDTAKTKWNTDPTKAWFRDSTEDSCLDPFISATAATVETVAETTGELLGGTTKLLGGLLGGGSTPPPAPAPAPAPAPETPPALPTSPTPRFAGKVFSVPVATSAHKLESLAAGP